MSDPAPVRVPAGSGEGELRERGSRFLGRAERARDEAEARGLEERERRRFHGATHHVLAYRPLAGPPRYDDDGEPSGTAGRPVLDVIDGLGVRDVAVVVTRWFGGTKLGTGGLARAYAETARRALESTPLAEVRVARPCRIEFEHGDTGAVMRLLEACGGRRGEAAYGSRVRLEALVPSERCSELVRRLAEATAGRAHVTVGEGSGLLGADPAHGAMT